MRAFFSMSAIAMVVMSGAAKADMTSATSRAKSKQFDATGSIRCAQEVGQALSACDAGIARAEDSAVAVVTFANGFSRMLMFSDGAFLRGNATMSGVGTDIEWQLVDGLYSIRVDDQRFELPEALVLGE